jgi:beta-glucanase (GH16 family)
MGPEAPRRRRWPYRLALPYHVALVVAAYAVTLVVAAAALLGWLGSEDGGAGGSPGEATAQARSAGPARTDAPLRSRPGWKLVWHDEFKGARCPKPENWSFEHGFVRNQELQWYQPENASCDRGALVIEARREESPTPNPNYEPGSDDWRTGRQSAEYTSASLISKRSFTYGRFEMRGRIDTRSGSWPAFWTLGAEEEWPRSGEVDVFEYYQGTLLANVCKPRRTECGWSTTTQRLAELGGKKWASRFHVWVMEWDAQKIDLLLDGKLVNRFRVARAAWRGERNPYVNKPHLLVLNQAIGGENGGDPSGTEFPVRFEIDYVRAYRHAGP